MMPKYTSSFVIALLLLASLCQAARPEPADPRNNQQKVVDEAGFDQTMDGCGGVGEDECLMRRTLEAHTDYIYTQDKKP